MAKKRKETLFKANHVRLLRERLVWIYRKSPPMIQDQINKTLKQFALAVSEYCECEEKVYVAPESKYACLNCGRRTLKVDSPKLEVVK